ncbi:MAG TPA: MFS transporter [Candidatus Acidoferrales bacterium]|nr:MFS transporter [Candidatus Acidoferrales bacterium]
MSEPKHPINVAHDKAVPLAARVPTSQAPQSGGIYAATTAFVVLFCIVGLALWGLPFYYDFMVQQFGWTRAQVTSGNAISKLVIGPAFGFFAGWIIDRFGPRLMMMTGIAMAGAALVGLGSISSLGMFYLFYFFNALGYVCGGPLPNQVLLTRWFDKGRGKAMGFAYLGIGFGGAAVPWIATALITKFGWQASLRYMGVGIVAVSLPLAFFLKETPAPAKSESRAVPLSVKAAFKSGSFYLLTLGSMCSIAAVSGTQQNLKLFLSLDRHFSQMSAARVLSLILTFSILGRLVIGWLADRISKKHVVLLTYFLVAVGIPLLFLGRNPIVLYMSAAVFGTGLGGDYMVIPLIAAELFNGQMLGRLLGVILTAGGMAEAVSPWMMSYLRDTTGSYLASCIVLVIVALLGMIAILGLPNRQKAT